jgi:hypothetical protein
LLKLRELSSLGLARGEVANPGGKKKKKNLLIFLVFKSSSEDRLIRCKIAMKAQNSANE